MYRKVMAYMWIFNLASQCSRFFFYFTLLRFFKVTLLRFHMLRIFQTHIVQIFCVIIHIVRLFLNSHC